MATMTKEQIEQKKQRLEQLAEEMMRLKAELVKAGAWSLDDDDLEGVAGGYMTTSGPPPVPTHLP